MNKKTWKIKIISVWGNRYYEEMYYDYGKAFDDCEQFNKEGIVCMVVEYPEPTDEILWHSYVG